MGREEKEKSWEERREKKRKREEKIREEKGRGRGREDKRILFFLRRFGILLRLMKKPHRRR